MCTTNVNLMNFMNRDFGEIFLSGLVNNVAELFLCSSSSDSHHPFFQCTLMRQADITTDEMFLGRFPHSYRSFLSASKALEKSFIELRLAEHEGPTT